GRGVASRADAVRTSNAVMHTPAERTRVGQRYLASGEGKDGPATEHLIAFLYEDRCAAAKAYDASGVPPSDELVDEFVIRAAEFMAVAEGQIIIEHGVDDVLVVKER